MFSVIRSASKSLVNAQKLSVIRVSSIRAFSVPSSTRKSGLADAVADELKYEREENSPERSLQDFVKMLEEKKFKLVNFEEADRKNHFTIERLFESGERLELSMGIVAQVSQDYVAEEEYDGEVEEDTEYESNELTYDVTVHVEKAGESLTFLGNASVGVSDASFVIDEVEFSPDAKLAAAEDAESDYSRNLKYGGPSFEHLDDRVQDAFYQYLEEKGVDSDLFSVLSDLAEWKEQKEYCKWLENVQKFVTK